MKRIFLAALCTLGSGLAVAQVPNSWSNEDYTFYAGDFNGDGFTDILYIGRNASLPSGILLSDGTAPTIAAQTWASNYLGIPWSSDAYTVAVGDFNGDGKTDIFLQSNVPGDSYLILTDSSGSVSAISQTIAQGAMGMDWSAGAHHLVVGDFNGDGRADLYLQPVFRDDASAIVYADANGQFTSEAPAQLWDEGYLGLNWSVMDANVFAGDFNGDRRSDLLLQGQPTNVGDANESTDFLYSPNMNGAVLSQPAAQPFTLAGVQAWSRMAFGVDWSPITATLIIGDFNGDGRADVLLQPLEATGSANLLFGNAPGPIFSPSSGSVASSLPISGNDAVLIAGRFAGGSAAGLLVQSASRLGRNSIAAAIASGIHPTAVTLPVLTASSVSLSGSSSVPSGSVGPQSTGLIMPLGAAIAPTSAGRTAGQFSITPTGAASYNIPLWTPPGARNIEPHLALHYTSGGPDGPMGPGWSLTGASAIVRCGKTWAASNGAPAGVTLTTSDEVCLDGNRLHLTSGTQLTTGSEYATEIADFSLTIASGTTGNGPQYFTVYGKDGRYYEYGSSATSQIFASGATTPYAWALSKVRDRQGNNMTFTYVVGASSLTLAKIQYTATPGTANPAPYEVDFNYVTRTGGSAITSYVAGSAVTRTQQLDNVNVLASGTSVRKYQLGYAASATTKRPLLQSVQECGGSAGTDCLRATTITYQTGGANWSTTATSTGLTGQYSFLPVDLNGDGIPDALYGKLSGSNILWYARIATLTGYGAEIATGASTSTVAGSQTLVIGAFDGTGKIEFLAPVGSTLYAYKYNGTGFSGVNTTAPSGSAQYVLDWDGDGLPDLVYYGGTGVTVRRNTTVGGGAITFASTTQTVFTTTDTLIPTNPVLPVDFNADGRADMLIRSFHTCCHGGAAFSDYSLLSNGFSTAPTQINLNAAIDNESENSGSATVAVGDWNGDGCTDVITPKAVFISDCAGHFTSFLTNIPILSTLPFPYPMQFVDVDGDGRMDLLYPDPTTNNWFVARSTGSGIAAGASIGIAYAATKALGTIDRDSDGQTDLLLTDAGAGYAVSYYAHNSARTPPDLASSIADGFGIQFNPTYVPISHSNYTKYADAVFPEMDFEGPMYAVNQFSASDGSGSTYTNDFYYWGARLHLQGRGFEGFYAARQHDSRSGIYTYSYYQRAFPYTGSVFEQGAIAPDQTTYLARTQNTYTYQGGPNCPTCYFPHILTSTVYNFEPTGTKAGGSSAYISKVVTNYTYNPYGSLTDTKVTTTDTDATTPVSPFNGQSWITEIKNTITDDSSIHWCLGRPTTTTTTQTVPGQLAQTRTVSHTIDYVNCRATVETVEPNDTRLKVTTSFGFDACGNTNSVSVVGLDQNGTAMPARTTTTNYGTRCQLPESVTNPYSQTTSAAYRYDLGLPSSTTDPNGIVTGAWLYDDFGRKTKDTHPDGTYTTVSYADCISATCWGEPNLRFSVAAILFNTAGTQLREAEQFYDGLDRLRYAEGNRATGVWSNVATYYDSLGRKTEVSLPYSSTGSGYHTYQYDILNRLIKDTVYTNAGVLYRATNMWYEGRTSFVADPNGNQIATIADVAGKIRRVTDDARNAVAGSTNYTFDPFGNLITIVDADNVTSSYSYNIRGFKTGSSDADTGAWTFTPDSLNELVSQHDANSNVMSFGYDLLGRMVSRTEPENPSTPTTWAYGTSATAHNIGRITQVSKPDSPNPYAEGYTYDSIGRPQTITYTEDATNYPFTYAYNNQGTIDTITYPVSTAGYQFVLKNVYDSAGFLSAEKDNAAGTVFWSLASANDSSLPTAETLGNGVKVSTTYTPWTNEMSSRAEGTGTQTNNLQNMTYDWDLAGNLHDRIDVRQTLTEQFSYDSMNRLLGSTLNGTTNLTVAYDAAGNIASKSDVSGSAYVYDTVHKHAVKTAGTWSMTYDANGNMTSRAGGAISWKSYNLPASIAYQSNSTQFWYNADHKRWKQIANYAGTTETTHYIGGLLEVMTRGSGPTEYRHQIPAGTSTVVYTRRSDGTSGTYYATSDHLGSSDLVMDSTATVLARQSFTPFGARRGSNWQGTPSASDYTAFGNTTRKGFTGHEMLDSVNLVHMNGRVYDPYLGRVLSADSVIQSLGASESINPYAYA
ncbi:MAG: FG-GAP-like repeat-containing protein, partial [Steroidobacteraceae bacterium]